MKRLLCVCLMLAGCASTTTHVDKTETFPGYTMRTFVFGSAKMAESAQSFHGSLTVTSPDGLNVVVGLNNGQNNKGLEASGLEAVVKSVVEGVVKGFVPISLNRLTPDQQQSLQALLEKDLLSEYNRSN